MQETDILTNHEKDIRAALKESDEVYADPLYRNLLSAEELQHIAFHDTPTESYSGRMYRDRIPVFLKI